VRALAGELAAASDGVIQHLIPSAFGITTTAHLFGGCVIGRGPDEGVVDADHRVFGYQDLYICDGSVIPTNPGTAPSLTIAAMAERCMAKIPAQTRPTVC
jgi:cholesterol oxidase